VARLDREGALRERVNLLLPRTLVFGAGDDVVVQQLPIGAGAPTLLTTPARRPERVRGWPGLVARAADDPEHLGTRNLVGSGLAFGRWLSCWFPDAGWFAVSDSATSRSGSATERPWRRSLGPIWDVALAAEQRPWVLAITAAGGRRGVLAGAPCSIRSSLTFMAT
jgi:hypothetical protein